MKFYEIPEIFYSPAGFAGGGSVLDGVGSGLDTGVAGNVLLGPATDFFVDLNILSSRSSMSCCSTTSTYQHSKQ